MKIWSRTPIALAAASMLVLTACGGGSSDSATGKADKDGVITVKLGVVGPKTGPAKLYFDYMTQDFETFSAEFEQKYKVKFDLVEEDDQASPEQTARAVSKLVNEEGVQAVMGPPLSGNSLQVADAMQRSKIPWLLPGPNADEIINYKIQPNWAFQTNFTNQQVMAILGKLLYKKDNTVGIVYSADGFGQSNVDQLKKWAKANGKTVAAAESIQPGGTDASAIVKRLKNAGVNSVFMGITQGADIATVTRAIEQAAFKPNTLMTTGTILTDYAKVAEPSQWKDIQIVDPRNFLEGGTGDVLKEIKATTGQDAAIPTNNISTYAILDIYAQAVQKVGNATDYEAVRKAMEDTAVVHIKGDTIDKPFSATDHALYDDDPTKWLVYGFDSKFGLKIEGTAAKCASSGC